MSTELEFADLDLQLAGRFTCIAAPVQAEGTVASRAFYFSSKYEAWSFAVALTPSVDPADIDNVGQGFLREGTYGSHRSDASYMPLTEARAIIARCAQEFLHQAPP